jgi:hypothetical protein
MVGNLCEKLGLLSHFEGDRIKYAYFNTLCFTSLIYFLSPRVPFGCLLSDFAAERFVRFPPFSAI